MVTLMTNSTSSLHRTTNELLVEGMNSLTLLLMTPITDWTKACCQDVSHKRFSGLVMQVKRQIPVH